MSQSAIMSMLFITSVYLEPGDNHHALILDTCGIPTTARHEKVCMPMPCCQGATSFKISNDNFNFLTGEMTTADEQNLLVSCSASYSVNSTSTATILKAYKSFPKERRQVHKLYYQADTKNTSDVSVTLRLFFFI